MEAKVRVYGKSQSRTVLGIINAYLILHPDSTLSDLQKAFPGSLNHKAFTDNIIVPIKETIGKEKDFFEREDEQIVLKNGQRLALVEVWRKEDYEAAAKHAEQYGIVVAEIEESKPFEKGSYELELLNDYVPVEVAPHIANKIIPSVNTQKSQVIEPEVYNDEPQKRKIKWWWWLLLLLLLLLLLFLCKKCCCCSDKCSVPEVTTSVITAPDVPEVNIADTAIEADASVNDLIRNESDFLIFKLPDGVEWKIPRNSAEYMFFTFLNTDDSKVSTNDREGWITLDKLSFESGKAALKPESETQLKNFAMIMKFFPNSNIKLGGHSDNTGSEELNIRLSSQRAKVVADKLVALGVEANRVTHEGYGSKFPVCPANDTDACKTSNRRVEVKVTKK